MDLEEIKKRQTMCLTGGFRDMRSFNQSIKDIGWLIFRVEELERENNSLLVVNKLAIEKIKKIEEELKEWLEVMKFYADKRNWDYNPEPNMDGNIVELDRGQKAREILGEI